MARKRKPESEIERNYSKYTPKVCGGIDVNNLKGTPWLIRNLAPIGFTQVWGDLGVGHTWLGLQICHAVTTKKPLLENPTDTQGEAVYLTLDKDDKFILGRAALVWQREPLSGLYLHDGHAENWDTGAVLWWLGEACKGDVKVAVIDLLTNVTTQGYGYEKFCKGIQRLSIDRKIGIIGLAHTPKSDKKKGSGTTGALGSAHNKITIERPDISDRRKKPVDPKLGYFTLHSGQTEDQVFTARLERDYGWVFKYPGLTAPTPEGSKPLPAVLVELQDYILMQGRISKTEIVAHFVKLGKDSSNIYRYLKALAVHPEADVECDGEWFQPKGALVAA